MMHFGIYKTTWYCRWCGKPYTPQKETDRDGFCCPKCKQAHHRAFKKYTICALRQKKRSKIDRTGTRKRSNAKKRKKKVRFSRPVRVKFHTKKDRKLRLP